MTPTFVFQSFSDDLGFESHLPSTGTKYSVGPHCSLGEDISGFLLTPGCITCSSVALGAELGLVSCHPLFAAETAPVAAGSRADLRRLFVRTP
jgi:hypothetical protein